MLLASLWLVRTTVPLDPNDAGAWMDQGAHRVELALTIVPFAGIAFLWFMGVVRDRLGVHEDQFFATVFMGSGLLFLASLFAASAIAGGLIGMYGRGPSQIVESGLYDYIRLITFIILNVYAMKMAGVFMIVTSTLILRTRIAPRWLALLGYVLALVLLVSVRSWEWSVFVFPLWILLLSIFLLVGNLRGRPQTAAS